MQESETLLPHIVTLYSTRVNPFRDCWTSDNLSDMVTKIKTDMAYVQTLIDLLRKPIQMDTVYTEVIQNITNMEREDGDALSMVPQNLGLVYRVLNISTACALLRTISNKQQDFLELVQKIKHARNLKKDNPECAVNVSIKGMEHTLDKMYSGLIKEEKKSAKYQEKNDNIKLINKAT